MSRACLQCGAAATQDRDTCTTCYLTAILRSVQAETRPEPEPELAPWHDVRPSAPTLIAQPQYTSAVVAGITRGLQHSSLTMLSAAAKMAATIGAVPASVGAAQAFVDFNQKHFYNHMRIVLKALDGKKKLPGKKRLNNVRNIPPLAKTDANQNLARALRFIRIYLQIEQKPMALMLGRSHASVWHIESADHVIHQHVVEAYGDALNIEPERIYRYAHALGRGGAKKHDAVDMVTKFVDIVARGK